MKTTQYRKQVLKLILDEVQNSPDILAAWEGGSSATGNLDEFSDIDLCLVASAPLNEVLDRVQKSLEPLQITHTWQPMKSSWGEGLMQRVIMLKDSPKYFMVDVGVFDLAQSQLLKSFLEVERHGNPVIYFDKSNSIQLGHTNAAELFRRQQLRAEELRQGFAVFKTLVLKEIDRGHAIDAIGFYQNGLVRPLIEVMGMLYRPYKFDFGMRYIHKSFPADAQKLIEELNYVAQFSELPMKLAKVEKAFHEAVAQVKLRKSL